MFIIVRGWEDDSTIKMRCMCACPSYDHATKVLEIIKKIDKFSFEESKKLKTAIREFEDSLGWKPLPPMPKKTEIDPHNLMSEKDWVQDYIQPFKIMCEKIGFNNRQINLKSTEFSNNWKYTIPEEFIPFKEYIEISKWVSVKEEKYTFSIENISTFIIKNNIPVKLAV